MNRQNLAVVIGVCVAIGVAAAMPSVGLAGQQTAPGTVDVPAGSVELGSVELPRQVMADGQTLAAGTYDVRVTADHASPDVAGQLPSLERWAEFRQGGEVRGREVASIIPQSEIQGVAKTAPPAPGTARVEMLKGDEYLRVWVNQGNISYLIHLVAG